LTRNEKTKKQNKQIYDNKCISVKMYSGNLKIRRAKCGKKRICRLQAIPHLSHIVILSISESPPPPNLSYLTIRYFCRINRRYSTLSPSDYTWATFVFALPTTLPFRYAPIPTSGSNTPHRRPAFSQVEAKRGLRMQSHSTPPSREKVETILETAPGTT
jgi:hypothetical protein